MENVDWSTIDPNMSEENFIVGEPVPDGNMIQVELPSRSIIYCMFR